MISELKTPDGVTILTDESQVVAKISEITVEEEPEPVVEEGAEGETSEGEPTENEGSKEEKPSEEPASEEKPE